MLKKCKSLFQHTVKTQIPKLDVKSENLKEVEGLNKHWEEADEPSEEDAKKHFDFLYSQILQGRKCNCLCQSPFFCQLTEQTFFSNNCKSFFLPRKPRKINFSSRILRRKRFVSRRTLF